jgi:DNA-binding beta-propeller fold protein YncE
MGTSKRMLLAGLAVLAGLMLAAPVSASVIGADGGVVVANRGAGSISVIDVETSGVTNFDLPNAGSTPEPMYVVYSPNNDTVFVGDRANNQVVAFDAQTFDVVDTIPTGAGVFHMWGEPSTGQLWVNNDVDKTVTVIDMDTFGVETTFATPTDLNDLGGKPHDVILDPNQPYGYVSMIGVSGGNDYVVQYDTATYMEINRLPVGGDPHLSLSPNHDRLYVPTQDTDEVVVVDRATLAPLDTIDVPNAHGATHSADGSIFYTTNIADGGADGLVVIDTTTDTVLATLSTPFGVPHNLALSPDEHLIYITHSGGGSDQVSIVDVSDPSNPMYLTSVTAGTNPFGIATVPEPSSLLLGLAGVAVVLRRRR